MRMTMVFASIIVGLAVSQTVWGQTGPPSQQKIRIFSSSTTFHYNGNTYTYGLSDDDLANTPSWNPEQNEPPLSPHRAVLLASDALRRFVKPGDEWRVDTIATTQPGSEKWIYDVSFSCSSARCLKERPTPRFTILVKMDGSTVEPAIKPDEE